MSIDTTAVKTQADAVYQLQQALLVAQKHMRDIRALNGQSGYSISIGGRSIAVAAMDSRTYQAVMVRGMEMIHLGALKALGAEISQIKERLHAAEKKLSELTKGDSA